MKQVGIWLDKRTAYIISQKENEKQALQVVISKIEEYKPRGGSGTRLKGGPQDVVQDSKFLEREKHQIREYFENIIKHIKDVDEMVLFGPAEMPVKLYNELKTNNPKLASKVKGVTTADSMTKGQMKSWVRKYFTKSKVKTRGW